MEKRRKAILLMAICASPVVGVLQAQKNAVSDGNVEESGVVLRLGSLKIANTDIELRCEVWNGTDQDIWVYVGRCPEDNPETDRATETEILLSDEETLLMNRRVEPSSPVWMSLVGCYTRVPAGQSCPQILHAPIADMPFGIEPGFMEAIRRGVQYLQRLICQVGYYTTEDLDTLKTKLNRFESVRFDPSGQFVRVRGLAGEGICRAERVVTLQLDRVSLPFR